MLACLHVLPSELENHAKNRQKNTLLGGVILAGGHVYFPGPWRCPRPIATIAKPNCHTLPGSYFTPPDAPTNNPFILKATGTRANHLSAFHRPDLYAESVDCRVGLGGAGLGASGDGVLIGVSELSPRASEYFSSCRRTCAVLGPYTSSWKCDAQRMQVLTTVAT